MIPDAGVLNKVLKTFNDKFIYGTGAITSDAQRLIFQLATIELVLVALWWAYSGSEAFGKFLKKVLFLTAFVAIINNYQEIIDLVRDSFIATGTKAGGSMSSTMADPSSVVDKGINLAAPLLALGSLKITSIMHFDLIDGLFLLITTFVILVAYFVLALQILLTRIEFGIISTLGLILVPLGVFKHTAFLAEKVFGAIISHGVKLMVLAFIVSVGYPVIADLAIPADPSFYDQIYTMVASMTIGVLAIHAPGVASGLLTGSPSLTAGSAVGAGAIAGAGAVTTFAAVKNTAGLAGKATLAAANPLAAAGVSFTKGAASKIGQTLGRGQEGGQAIGSGARGTGQSSMNSGAGGAASAMDGKKGGSQGSTNFSAPTNGGGAGSLGAGDSSSGSKGYLSPEPPSNEDKISEAFAKKGRGGKSQNGGTDKGEESASSSSSQKDGQSPNQESNGANNADGKKLSRPEDYFESDKAKKAVNAGAPSKLSRVVNSYQVGSSLLSSSSPTGGTVAPIRPREEE